MVLASSPRQAKSSQTSHAVSALSQPGSAGPNPVATGAAPALRKSASAPSPISASALPRSTGRRQMQRLSRSRRPKPLNAVCTSPAIAAPASVVPVIRLTVPGAAPKWAVSPNTAQTWLSIPVQRVQAPVWVSIAYCSNRPPPRGALTMVRPAREWTVTCQPVSAPWRATASTRVGRILSDTTPFGVSEPSLTSRAIEISPSEVSTSRSEPRRAAPRTSTAAPARNTPTRLQSDPGSSPR